MNIRAAIPWLCIFAILSPAALQAKARTRIHKAYDCSGKLRTAIEKFNKGHYADVELLLNDVKVQCSGHEAMDSIIYYLGQSLLLGKKPEEAKIEFQELIRDYPNSVFDEVAHFRLGQASYFQSNPFDRDQAETKSAIRELTEFVDTYSTSPYADSARAYLVAGNEKLAKKELMNARFYEKIDEYEAAVVYYKALITDYPQSSCIPDAKIAMAQALLKINRSAEADQILDSLLQQGTPAAIKEKAQALKARVKQPG